MVTVLLAGSAAGQQVVTTTAQVWRDEHGMPHIEAEDEPAAWYALGYEEARDALPWIQVIAKVSRGRAFETFARAPFAVFGLTDVSLAHSDLMVELFQTRPTDIASNPAALRQRFGPKLPGITANFYDNIVAYCAGINAYRAEVQAASGIVQPAGGSQQERMKAWLDSTVSVSLSWMYNEPVDPIDILGVGRFIKAGFAYGVGAARLPQVNSLPGGFTLTGQLPAAPVPEVIPFPGATPLAEWMQEWKKRFPGPYAGSNSFAFSYPYIRDAQNRNWTMVVADPHSGIASSFALPPSEYTNLGYKSQAEQIARDLRPNVGHHEWYAHIKVTPSGSASPTLDALGRIQHGTGSFAISHNKDVAYGGSLAAPLLADAFLLRLREDPQNPGEPKQPYEYYSYYADSDNDNGADNSDWLPLVDTTYAYTSSIAGATIAFKVWRAGPFGVIIGNLNLATAGATGGTYDVFPKVYIERDSSWRVTPNAATNKVFASRQYDAQGQLTTWPAVGCVRSPVDRQVDTQPDATHHDRYFVGTWEIAHAATVAEVRAKIDDHDCGLLVNLAAADRTGALFGTVAGTVPQRGNDASLLLGSYYSFPEKFLAYCGSQPVPARRSADRMFDWQPSVSGQVNYLRTDAAVGPQRHPFVLYVPPTASSPAAGVPLPENGENPGFINLSNEVLWGAWSNTASVVASDTNPPTVRSGTINHVKALNNDTLQSILDDGTSYFSRAFAFEALDRNQRLTDELKQRTPSNPLTIQEALTVAVDNKLHAPTSYPDPAYRQYPTPVRLVKEARDQMDAVNSPRSQASREIKFLADLDQVLSNEWSSVWLDLPGGVSGLYDLGAMWRDGQQVAWYGDPADPESCRWLAMPPDYPLIDFRWDSIQIGQGAVAQNDGNGGLSPDDFAKLKVAVARLVNWRTSSALPLAERYRMTSDSEGAALLEMWSQGFEASGSFGRHWSRQKPIGSAVDVSMPWALRSWGPVPYTATLSMLDGWPSWPVREVPLAALYEDPVTRNKVKSAPSPADINAIVEFFLALSGDYVPPATNNGNPSRRMERYLTHVNNVPNPTPEKRIEFAEDFKPPLFPLTQGLAKIVVLRRLIDAADYLGSPAPKYGEIFRITLNSYTGDPAWPLAPGSTVRDDWSAPCEGGMLRAIAGAADRHHPGYLPDRGFQPRFFYQGGSHATLVTLFPAPTATNADVESYFWCTTGLQPFGDSDAASSQMMQSFAANQLLPTHYRDYRQHAGSVQTASHSYTR